MSWVFLGRCEQASCVLIGAFTAIGFLRYPTLTAPGMPSVRCLECQQLCKSECHEDLFAPSPIPFAFQFSDQYLLKPVSGL